jgi:osmotically-inducible protein OsmY
MAMFLMGGVNEGSRSRRKRSRGQRYVRLGVAKQVIAAQCHPQSLISIKSRNAVWSILVTFPADRKYRENEMKSDAELKRDVVAELAWDPQIKETSIGVTVKDAVVTLTGHIETYAEKYAARDAVQRVAGVKATALELDVRLAPEHKRSDTDIAISAEQALKWSSSASPDKIRLTVDHGWVTIKGEVEWDFQRRSVENAIRPLTGVVGLSDELTLVVKPQAADLSNKIEEALKRQAVREAGRIEVHVAGATVKLSGRVHSWNERATVEGVVWSAPGVRSVVNDLAVG